MTRFVYLSDTHIGASGLGYHQQQAYPERLPEIVAALSAWIRKEGNIDFVLHAGDMADNGTAEQIRRASDLFKLPVPIYLCLGNHDLSEKDSLENWLELAPQFFAGDRPEFVIETDDCAVHVIPNQWGDPPYFWKGDSYPHPAFLPDQLRSFEESYRKLGGKTQLFLTHSPVLGVPVAQTGFSRPFHEPEGRFKDIVFELLQERPEIRCVLGAHSHINMRVELQGVNYITSSAMIETPFEYKLFEVDLSSIRMKTLSLASSLPFQTTYNPERSFVQGRTPDREMVHHFRRSSPAS